MSSIDRPFKIGLNSKNDKYEYVEVPSVSNGSRTINSKSTIRTSICMFLSVVDRPFED